VRIYIELAVVLAIGVFAYVKIAPRWRGWSQPLAPVFTDIGPSAPMPGEGTGGGVAAPMAVPVAKVTAAPAMESMMVVPEAVKPSKDIVAGTMGQPTLAADAAPVFTHQTIAKDSLAHAKPADDYQARMQPKWLTKLKSLEGKEIAAGVVAGFVLLFLVLAKSLRDGNADKLKTHE
jgi:hypothetical protein